MTDEATSANVDRLAILTTKLERESRATRYLLVICTAANIAVITFGLKVAYEYMPPIMLAHFMEHMPEMVMTHHAVENALTAKRNMGAAPAPAPAPAPAGKK